MPQLRINLPLGVLQQIWPVEILAQKSALDTDLLNVSNSAILHDLCRRGQYSIQSPTDNHVEEQQIYVILT